MEGWNGIFSGIFQLREDPSRSKDDSMGLHPRLGGAKLNIPHCGSAPAPPPLGASSGSPCPGPDPDPCLAVSPPLPRSRTPAPSACSPRSPAAGPGRARTPVPGPRECPAPSVGRRGVLCGCMAGREAKRVFFLCSASVERWEAPQALPGPRWGGVEAGASAGETEGRLWVSPVLSTGPCTAKW